MQVLHGVDIQVDKGEIVALLGANGAGKSTLAGAISGLVPISSGVARVFFLVLSLRPEGLFSLRSAT